MAMRRASRNTFRIKVQNISNCTGNNSTYSDTSQLAAGWFISLFIRYISKATSFGRSRTLELTCAEHKAFNT
jgi:hypothetical protein